MSLDNFRDIDLTQVGNAKSEAAVFQSVEVGEFSCANCQHKTKTPMKQCQGCKKVHYCRRKCQADDWEKHKAQCS